MNAPSPLQKPASGPSLNPVAAELRLATIVNSAGDAIIGKTLDGVITSWNPGAERIFGYPATEAVGRPILMLFPPERVAEESVLLASIGRGESVRHFETVRVRKDGRRIDVSVTLSPIIDGTGKIIGASKIAQDITARRQVERALEESNARFTVVMENLSEGLIMADLAGNLIHWNPAALRMYGFTNPEEGKRRGDEFAKIFEIWSLDGKRLTPDQGPLSCVLRGEPVRDMKLRLRRKDIEWERVFKFNGAIARYADDQSLAFLTVSDITEHTRAEQALRQSQAEFRDLFDNAPVGYHEVDSQGQITRINETELKMLGYTAQELLGKPVWKISADEDVSRQAVLEKLKGAVPARAFERWFKRKDGSTFAVLIEDRLVAGPDGRIAGIRSVIKDITERKAAEAALKESEVRFRTMANSISHLAWIARADGFIFWYNQRWFEYTGTTPQQMEGWGWQTVHDPRRLPDVMAQWTNAIAAGKTFEMEFPLRGADGKFRAFLTRALPLKNDEGEVVQWFGTNTDVESLKQAEEAVRLSERKLREVIDGLGPNTFLGLMTPDGILIEANRPGLVAAGIKPEDALGKPFDQTFWWGHSEPVRVQLRAAMARAAAGEAVRYDIQVRVAGNALVWIDFSLTPVRNSAGQVVYLVPSGNVIEERVQAETALRQSEEHFRFLNDLSEATRTLADPAQVMAVMARMLGQHLHASRCAYADVEPDGEQFSIQHDYTDGCASTVGDYQLSLFGARAVTTLTRGETLIIRKISAELLPDEGAAMFNAIGIQAIICCPLVKQGRLRAMMAVHQASPRDWQPREIAIVQDVVERCWATIERRAAEEKVIQLNAELEQRVIERTAQLAAAIKELEAFSYSVSHDLRAPLRAVNGFAAIVLEDFASQVPEEARRHLERIRSGGQQMGELIDNLLDFSRLARQPLARQTVDHNKLIQSVLEELEPQRKDRPIELHTGSLPPSQGDPALLKQVWVNLLANAIKYTRGRKPAVIEINCNSGDGDLVYFVKDNGTGFDMKYAGKLFGVFQRLHRADEFEGTGVGLAIVQRIIHRHGGRVWAEAEPDRGATFYFTLPTGARI